MSHPTLKKFLIPECTPTVHESAFLAPGCFVLGAVELATETSIWFGAVLRGDINSIIVGPQSNVQDGSVLHVSDDFPCILGQRVTVGHRAVVHACRVGDEVLIGMGAIILDGAVIGARSIVAAGALVPKGMQVPEGSLVMGSPARVVRPLTEVEKQANAQLALKYVAISRRYLEMDVSSLLAQASNSHSA
ncbi:MAG: gamma carbonic anhydrase family protein [Verrucomicrobia bacterium]|nr:gamma carbonic anhydrase family protein [Verrucomicrobiota bacterium]